MPLGFLCSDISASIFLYLWGDIDLAIFTGRYLLGDIYWVIAVTVPARNKRSNAWRISVTEVVAVPT